VPSSLLAERGARSRARAPSFISDSIAERAVWRACGGHTTRESCPPPRRFPRPDSVLRFAGEPRFDFGWAFGFGFAGFGLVDFGFEAARGLGALPFPRLPPCGRGLT
jgi:hypothetical protein